LSLLVRGAAFGAPSSHREVALDRAAAQDLTRIDDRRARLRKAPGSDTERFRVGFDRLVRRALGRQEPAWVAAWRCQPFRAFRPFHAGNGDTAAYPRAQVRLRESALTDRGLIQTRDVVVREIRVR
jgi:hypothetical protein